MSKFDFKKCLEDLQKDHSRKQRAVKKLRQSILIVSEGSKTEPLYFEQFKNRLPKEVVKNFVILGEGANTISLIKAAKRENKNRKKNFGRSFDQTWIVFDRDSFDVGNVNQACHQAIDQGYHLAYSNESFELWYLLHFQYLDTKIGRSDYIKKLNEILTKIGLPKYSKSDEKMYMILLEYGDQSLAIKHSERLEKMHEGSSFADMKPSTSVYKLVQLLNEYLYK